MGPLRRLRALVDALSPNRTGTQSDYCKDVPRAANALHLYDGDWITALPDGLGGGEAQLFDDGRIHKMLKAVSGIDGGRVLELGPLEGAHTFMLHRAGASEIVAIEANNRAYLRSLAVKETFGLDRARFLLGDFDKYEAPDDAFDFALACGVIYHSADPVRSLTRLCRVASKIGIWSHYFEEGPVRARFGPRFDYRGEVLRHEGVEARCYLHTYGLSTRRRTFCGGLNPVTRWMDWDSWHKVLEARGFRLEVLDRQPEHPNGPAFTGVAVRV